LKIGILSDTHNHTANTQAVLATFRERGITRLIHCGDITSAQIVLLFAGWDVTFALGNMDQNRDELVDATRLIAAPPPVFSCRVEVEGKRIGVTHGADSGLLYRMLIGNQYDYVCHGHTHQRRDQFLSEYGLRLINPGALGGIKQQTRSVCILDTGTGDVEFIEFPEMS
jgi:putative phosphoesterase